MKKRFLEAAARAFGVKASELSLESGREDVRGWDSLGHLKLFMAIESEFRVNLPSKKIMRYESLGEIFADIEKCPR